MTVRRAVLSYVNPDTDGVACMLAYRELLEAQGSRRLLLLPMIFGVLNAETLRLLGHLGIPPPPIGTEDAFDTVDEICLVDTHHRAQLPPYVPIERVVDIIDHHGSGDIKPSGARIQNELVGAAATLLIERYQASNARPSAKIGQLLVAAVLSNTLDLAAPTTTPRDESSIRWIGLQSASENALRKSLRQGREVLIAGETPDVLCADVKLYSSADGRSLAISQVEGPSVAALLNRGDLHAGLRTLEERSAPADVLVNLVDTGLQRSVLICSSLHVRNQLTNSFGLHFDLDGVSWTEEIFLRKTHLVPALVG